MASKVKGEDPSKALGAIESDFNNNKDDVIKMLIANVLNVNVEVPRVVKGNFEEE